MDDLDLFPARFGDAAAQPRRPAVSTTPAAAPLAARLRPRTLDEFVGQEHLLGAGRTLRQIVERDEPVSFILWGPPGTGKTTLARIVAERTRAFFVPFSAVTDGVPRLREITREAEARLAAGGPRTLLFCDEIHRFNKAQQDAFLPHVEAGTISLIGATTENPSFEVNGALLSRSRVFVLQALETRHLEVILDRALAEPERGLGGRDLSIDEEAVTILVTHADGDARRLLNILETTAALVGPGGRITAEVVREAAQHRFARYDKSGEEPYNLISALHKAVRGSDPQGALYWLARMLEGGEDPLFLARRLVRMASEDIGLADPQALQVALACRDAFHFLGSPEGDLALAQVAVYLATAPKSNRLYVAFAAARDAARKTPAEPVPEQIRNAPTRLMKDLGYGRDYRYAFDSDDHYIPQEYLPDRLRGSVFYQPSIFGHEKRITERLAWWERLRTGATRDGAGSGSNEQQKEDHEESR